MSNTKGVWVIYDHDHGPYLISIHSSAEEAAQETARQGYGRVGWVQFGQDFPDQIREWEKRP